MVPSSRCVCLGALSLGKERERILLILYSPLVLQPWLPTARHGASFERRRFGGKGWCRCTHAQLEGISVAAPTSFQRGTKVLLPSSGGRVGVDVGVYVDVDV